MLRRWEGYARMNKVFDMYHTAMMAEIKECVNEWQLPNSLTDAREEVLGWERERCLAMKWEIESRVRSLSPFVVINMRKALRERLDQSSCLTMTVMFYSTL
jgi:hypothetical protein